MGVDACLRDSRARRGACLITAAAALQLVTPGPVLGDMVSATASPRSVPVSSVGASSAPRPVLVRWSLASTNGVGTVTSTSGVFRAGIGGPVIGSIPGLIVAPIAGGLASASETIRVPPGLAQQATNLGASILVYERVWDDTDTALAASLALVIGGGKGGLFEAQRVELSFDDGTSLRMVDRGGPLRARAEISYSGSGVVEAVWEVALGGDTAGTAIFQPLQRVRRQLGAGGRMLLEGPLLPTARHGFHLVRLRLLEPAPAFREQQIRYLVADPPPREVGTLAASGPPEAGRLDAASRFQWEAQPEAAFYQLEFFDSDASLATGPEVRALAPDASSGKSSGRSSGRSSGERDSTGDLLTGGQLVAGVALPSRTLETRISLATRARLRTGATYLWHVRAIAPDGRTIAASPLRSLHVAAEDAPSDPASGD